MILTASSRSASPSLREPLFTCLEGVGLVLGKVWAEYVTLILTASFLPWEVIEIIRHVTWIKVVLLLVNLAVVIYLVFYVQMMNVRAKSNCSRNR